MDLINQDDQLLDKQVYPSLGLTSWLGATSNSKTYNKIFLPDQVHSTIIYSHNRDNYDWIPEPTHNLIKIITSDKPDVDKKY